jgi:hypothetical protein
MRRRVGQILRELRGSVPEEWHWMLDEVQELLAELPPQGNRRIFELWKQIPERELAKVEKGMPLERLRDLLTRGSEHWVRYRVFHWQKGVPWSNNGTEFDFLRIFRLLTPIFQVANR